MPAGGRSRPVNCNRAEYKRLCHLSNVCVSRSKYNSMFTHELCILCGRHYLCGDVVPLRSPCVYLGVNITVRLLTNYVFYVDGIIYAVM